MIKYPAIKNLATSKPQHKYAISSTWWFISPYSKPYLWNSDPIRRVYTSNSSWSTGNLQFKLPFEWMVTSSYGGYHSMNVWSWMIRNVTVFLHKLFFLFIILNCQFLQLSLLSDPSRWTIVSSWKLRISAYLNLFHLNFCSTSFNLIRPLFQVALFYNIKLHHDCPPSSPFQLGNKNPQLTYLWDHITK